MIPYKDKVPFKLCDYSTQFIGYLITHGGGHIRDIDREFHSNEINRKSKVIAEIDSFIDFKELEKQKQKLDTRMRHND